MYYVFTIVRGPTNSSYVQYMYASGGFPGPPGPPRIAEGAPRGHLHARGTEDKRCGRDIYDGGNHLFSLAIPNGTSHPSIQSLSESPSWRHTGKIEESTTEVAGR
jgi:hypothetical protein